MKTTVITSTLNAYLTKYSSVGPDDFRNPTEELFEKLHFAVAKHIPEDWTIAGTAVVTLTLVDRDTLIENKVESLRAELTKVKAEAYQAQTILENKINTLLAIAYEPEVA